MTNAIITTIDDAERAARAMAQSGYFPDSRQAAQAVVKILAGQELGFGPFASMTGVSVIQGKPVLGANMLAAAVKRTGKYNYKVAELSDTACELVFFEDKQEVGRSRFTMDDAKRANLTAKDNWVKYPRNMLFARALSNGQRWYAPDIFNGALVYTPDELGATTDEDGNAVIDVQATQVEPQETQAESHIQEEPPPVVWDGSLPEISYEAACNVTSSEGLRYGDLSTRKLSYMANSLRKANHIQADETKRMKLSAIQTILAHRKEESA